MLTRGISHDEYHARTRIMSPLDPPTLMVGCVPTEIHCPIHTLVQAGPVGLHVADNTSLVGLVLANNDRASTLHSGSLKVAPRFVR